MKKRILSFLIVLSIVLSAFVTIEAKDNIIIDASVASSWTNSGWANIYNQTGKTAYTTDNVSEGVDVNFQAGKNVYWSNGSAPVVGGKRDVSLNRGTNLFEFDVEIPEDEAFALKTTYLALSTKSGSQNENNNISVVLQNDNNKYQLYLRLYKAYNTWDYYIIDEADTFDDIKGWHHVKFALDISSFILVVYSEDGSYKYRTKLNEISNNDLKFSADTKLNYAAVFANNTEGNTDKTITYKNFYITALERTLSADITVNAQVTSAELEVEFSEAVDVTGLEDLIKVTSAAEKAPKVEVEKIDDTHCKIVLTELFGNTDYNVSVDKLFAKSGRTSENLLINERFKTSRSAGIYVDTENSTLRFNNTELSASTEISYIMNILNTTTEAEEVYAGVALYAENERLIDFDIVELTSAVETTEETFSFTLTESGAERICASVWSKNEDGGVGTLITTETVSGTYTASAEKTSKKIPEFEIKVADTENVRFAITGNFADSEKKYVTVAFVQGKKTELDFDDTDIVAFATVKVNEDGSFAYEFQIIPIENQYDYTAFVLTGSEVYYEEFDYMPISTLADFVKDIADGKVEKDDICSGARALNNGFGIDFENYFKTEKEINLFNGLVYAGRSAFTGPNDSDYVKQFMEAVEDVIERIDYVNNVNAAESEAKMLKLLQDGVKYTSISFTAYNALTEAQKNLALTKMTSTEFDSMEEIKPAFERFVSAASQVVYLSKGYASFDSVANGAISNNGGSFEMKFNSGSVQVVDDEVARLKGDKNKALKVSPSQAGTKFYLGLICTGQWNDMLYTKMGLDSSKLLMFGLDVYFPSQMLTEEYMETTGLNLMPGSGNYVNDGWILTDSVFKKVNSDDKYLTFVNGQKELKKIETDKWHNINIIYDFTSNTIRYYIDGEMLLKDYDAATKLDLTDMGCGIRYVCPSNVSGDFTIYFDNVEIYQSSEEFGISTEYNRDSDDFVISLTSAIDKSMLSEITTKVDGTALTNGSLSADGKEVRYDFADLSLKNDKEYCANIEVTAMLTDGLNQYISKKNRSVESKFTTTRSKEMYITDDSTFDGNDYKVEVRNLSSAKEALVAVAEYGENEQLLKVCYKTQNMENGKNTVTFENVDSTKQIKSFLWTDNWSLKHNPIVVNAQDKSEAPIKSDAVVPNYSIVTTDAGNEVLTVSGKYSGEADSFVTVIISDDAIENYKASTIALEATRTDKDGLFGVSFKMAKPSGKYNAYVIIDGKIYKQEFSYSSLSDTSGVVKKLAKGEIAQDDVYDSVIVYNSGFGIDTAYFTEKSGKDTFNKRVMQKKSVLVGPENTDYVSQFMTIVKSIIAELDYTKELQDVPYAGSIKAKLDEGTSYTNIDFTAYNALTAYQQSLVQEDMLKAVFTDGDDIKTKFDSFVNNAKGKIPPTTGGGTSGTGGGGGTSVIPSTFNGNNSNNNNSENKDLFNDLNKSHWAAAAIARLVNKNIVSGMGNGNYEPDLNVKREQFVKMGVLGAGLKTVSSKSEFKDVSDDSWYCEYVMTAKENNIISGMADGSFGTGANITREDMAVIVYNILKQNNVGMEEITDDSLSDFESISDYAKEAVKQLYAKKIINGMGDGSFAPKSYATRAQAATIIDAMMTELGK